MFALLQSKQIMSHIQEAGAISWHSVMYNAAATGDLETLKLLSVQNETSVNQASCFEYACATGHKNIVNFFLEHLKQFQLYPQTYQKLINLFCSRGFVSACQGGHLDIVQVMVENYEPSPDHINRALKAACSSCVWDVIFYLKEKFGINQFNELFEACRGKHRKLVDWLIENGAYDWNRGLMGACESGDMSLMKLMIERGATNIDHGLARACEMGHVEQSKYLLEALHRVLPVPRLYFNYIHNVEIKKLLIECDEASVLPVRQLDICPLLNQGISLQKLLLYPNPNITTQIADLAARLLQVVQVSLQGMLCSDLVNVLKIFIGYDVNAQVMETIAWEP